MSANIEITHAQASTLASLSERQGPLVLHQVADAEHAEPSDLYATPRGAAHGYRITVDGTLSEIGKTLPAPE